MSSSQVTEHRVHEGPLHELTVRGSVATLLLTDVTTGNAISLATVDGLLDALDVLPGDVRALVLASAGGSFSVGGDVKGFAAAPDLPAHIDELVTRFHALVERIRAVPVPSVCAVTGWAAGGGIGLALAADVVVAGRSARLRAGYSGLGLTSDGGTAWHLARALGPGRALDVLLTNEPLGADEALRAGLVSRVVDDEEVLATAHAVADTIARLDPRAVADARSLVRRAHGRELSEHLRHEHETMVAAAARPEVRRGVEAFMRRGSTKGSGR